VDQHASGSRSIAGDARHGQVPQQSATPAERKSTVSVALQSRCRNTSITGCDDTRREIDPRNDLRRKIPRGAPAVVNRLILVMVAGAREGRRPDARGGALPLSTAHQRHRIDLRAHMTIGPYLALKRGRTTYEPLLKNNQDVSILRNRWEAGEATCSRTRRSKHQASHPPTLIEKAPSGGLFTRGLTFSSPCRALPIPVHGRVHAPTRHKQCVRAILDNLATIEHEYSVGGLCR